MITIASNVACVLHFYLKNTFTFMDCFTQIADFGMSRDLTYESYYISQGGMIPVKWTAPEVSNNTASLELTCSIHSFHRPFTTRNTPQPVMCGAMELSCMRFGVWDTSPLKI